MNTYPIQSNDIETSPSASTSMSVSNSHGSEKLNTLNGENVEDMKIISSGTEDICPHKRLKLHTEGQRVGSYSLNAPPPEIAFGPKAYLKGYKSGGVVQDPADQQLGWIDKPRTVLVVKKDMDDSVSEKFKQVIQWLQQRGMDVVVEESVANQPCISDDTNFQPILKKLKTLKGASDEDTTKSIDLVIGLGGDGTFLHASSLFQQSVPPLVAFNLGSLGFLTKFNIVNYESVIRRVLEGSPHVTLRSRLTCEVHWGHTKTVEKHAVLNEIVIDRGPSPFITNLNVTCNDSYITTIVGDGLIISTPTGSTAYSLASGGCMVHPGVPAMLFTPICPHALSARPVVLPAGVELKLQTSKTARGSAWISLDGRSRQEFSVNDHVTVTTSVYPVACVTADDPVKDWFVSINECFHWNIRHQQSTLS